MKTEVRFLLAIVLMIVILVGTNLLFPPIPPDPAEPGEDAAVEEVEPTPDAARSERTEGADPGAAVPDAPTLEDVEAPATAQEETITVEGPLYRYVFSNIGARLVSVELLEHESFTREGPVQLIPEPGESVLTHRLLVGQDTVDFSDLPFEVDDPGTLRVDSDTGPQRLGFTWRDPAGELSLQVTYVFDPDSYLVEMVGRVGGVNRGLLFTRLGSGLASNEADPDEDARSMAYVANHRQEGVVSQNLGDFTGTAVVDGPFYWVAFKSKYFLLAMLAGETNGGAGYLGGLIAREVEPEHQVAVDVTQSLGTDGGFAYHLFAGPQDRALLSDVGYNLTEVNPIGWRFFRPIIRPFVAATIWVLVFLHENLNLGYGFVLIVFGILMRVLLFPLNHKAMKAQLRNMAVQPLLKDIQTRYKDQPERLQKELMKLYKEHGFNPLAGCWPMLLPWPVLISLFFVFQNTIELRGVPFLWLPDLASQDPLYILPLLLGVSMFFLQWVSFRTMQEVNPQMKMMMWLMPIFMVFIFFRLPSGLNLYYVTANIATLPQTWWIAQERVKQQAKGPLVPATDDDEGAGSAKGGGAEDANAGSRGERRGAARAEKKGGAASGAGGGRKGRKRGGR
ncbi:MAG: membrane protein insertase YidC [Gemmatimonadota bacterium]